MIQFCLDDLPLIRPPKQHTMVHMTGGLTNLYKRISKIRQDNGCKDVPIKSEDQILLEKSDVEKVPLTDFYKNQVVSSEDNEESKDDKSTEKESKELALEDKAESSRNEINGEENKNTEAKELSNGELENMETEEEKSQVDDPEKKKALENDLKEDGTDDKEKETINESSEDKENESNENEKVISSNDGDADKKKEIDKIKEKDKNDNEESKIVKENEVNKEKSSSEKDKANKEKVELEEEEKSEKEAKEESDDEDDEEEEEEEETTEFTDEDGEFVPVVGMPLLANRYKYLQVLGRGQSALIIKVEDTFCKNKELAIKVLHQVYKPIGSQEADILLELQRADPYFHVPFARVKTQFLYGPHYCLVFDCLLPTPLYTYYDQKDIRGASSLPYIRHLAVKLLTVMGFLQKQNVIHADLKPENILLRDENDLNSIMVVDFGNALRNTEEELSLYYSDFELQTLLYRAPEVIFGLRFSLEVDMWSLGCLLAECYIGKPLFFGKTKEEILTKICKLLGPFPKEFSEGMCGEEFAEFIGRPLSRYQRIENLSKRLNKCTDMAFLLLVERMLTYVPEQRVVPADAACHPFVAHVSPFLYLTLSSGQSRYPTILLDNSTYPHRPEHMEEDDEVEHRAASRKRLLSYAHRPPKHENLVTVSSSGHTITTTTAADNLISVNKQNKTVSVAPTSSSQAPVSRSDVKETLKSMGLRCEDFTISVYSKEQAHAILRKQGVEVTNHVPPSNNRQSQSNSGRSVRSGGPQDSFRSSSVSVSRPNNRAGPGNRPSGMQGNAQPRPATNTSQSRPPPVPEDDDDDDCVILDPPVNSNPRPLPPKPRLPQQFQLMGTTVQVNRGSKRPYSGPQNSISSKRPMMSGQYHNSSGNYGHHQQYRQMPQQRFSSRQRQYQQMMQQQYMDDYSDEDSSGESSVQDTLKRLKNYNVSITCRRNEQPPSRQGGGAHGGRHFANSRQMAGNVTTSYHPHGGNPRGIRQSNQMMRDHNMSRAQQMMRGSNAMTRQNMMRAQNMHMMQRNMMQDGDSDYDDDQMMDSDEEAEADMAKYLECEIGEDNMGQMVEGDEELHFDDDDEDHLEEGEVRRSHHMANARRMPASNTNPAKGKYSHLATKKRSAPPPQSEEADTSIEEVTLSRGSEPESEPGKAKQKDLKTNKKLKEKDGDDNEKDDAGNDHDNKDEDEDQEEEEEEDGEEEEGEGREQDESNIADLVDNMLERHLQAVSKAADGEAESSEEAKDSELMNEEEPKGGEERDDAESPMNEDELLGDSNNPEDDKEVNQVQEKKGSKKDPSKTIEDSMEDDLKDEDDGDEIDEELEKELLAGEGDL
ncbi:hypothetical protein HAZT_HAZT006404 [Hyalella azteca]|uniref:Protein kinase domain-containing protein n=1 Tax=Hyalella azteca TaxID=294128 RepID=A0A6A0GW13_HYAAZ|nr:hypothetical protein HAZT_HAZT006404 [Hyalella azteca]